jgi:hypothetical protein
MLPGLFARSNKTANEVSVIAHQGRYRVVIPSTSDTYSAACWCYQHLGPQEWSQYRDFIRAADVNEFQATTWRNRVFEFDTASVAVEFALRFS